MAPAIKDILPAKARLALKIVRAGGPGAGWKYLRFLQRRIRDKRAYREWLRGPGRIDESDILERTARLQRAPLISVLVPVYNIEEKWLRACLDSVLHQIYPNWELCIADDASTLPHVRSVLEEYAATDDRIRVVFRPENGHISAASNSALEIATGEFVVLLDHDDELSPDALFWVANEIVEFPATAMIYSDDDLIDESGGRSDPKFKPDFSRDLFYSTNLVTHLSAYRTELLPEIGGFRLGFEGSQDYDLALRVLERVDESQIRHIPRILYHWRAISGSVAFSMDEKPYAHERARRAIKEHLERRGIIADVSAAPHHLHRVRYAMPVPRPAVEVIISTADTSLGTDAFPEFKVTPVKRSPAASYVERLNTSARASRADVLLFIDEGLPCEDPSEIDAMIATALQPDIGCVGAKILGSDKFVEQTGLVLGSDLSVACAHRDFPRDDPGDTSRNLLIGNFSAVSTAAMAVSREAFEAAGGFDRSVDGMFDVDLCLRLRELGKRIVVIPDVVFVRIGREPTRQVSAEGLQTFRTRWEKYRERDPHCSVHLTRDGSFRFDLK